ESTVVEVPIPFETNEGDRSFGGYWNGSIHLLSDGVEGKRTTRKGNVSGIEIEESVTPPTNAGYRIYTARPVDRVIALTFDDGPWPQTTDAILDILQQHNAKATFFVIGNQISSYATQVKRADSMGCQICTHTWDHAAGSGGGVSIATMSAEEQIQEVQKGYAAIAEALGTEPAHILRAPGGNFFGDTIANLWPYVDAEIGWDVDTEDWRRPGTDAIYNAIMTVQPGQVILMHDGGGERDQTVEALRRAMPKLVEQGYKFVTVDELLAYGLPA
ncbi:MAG: polysaccharide deacetylase family protein, partial [Atopobiaceae bacterium]|nr:polysaccharide deacetylase family protein [Atopobiaceae bacterium]